MVPGTDWNLGDERERCPLCTAKYGMAHCGPGYVEHLCCGMNKPPNRPGNRRADSRRLTGEMNYEQEQT